LLVSWNPYILHLERRYLKCYEVADYQIIFEYHNSTSQERKDQNQWRAICGSKTPNTTKETPISFRQDIWAKPRYGNVSSWVQKLTRKTQMSKRNEQNRENTRSQTSRLENPEGLQVHHNHEKFLFLTVLLLFSRCKMSYWWLVTRLDLTWKIKVKIGSVDSEIESTFGVRQGFCKGPVLFLFIIQAALETMKWLVPKPEFCTRESDPGWT
jgi:hypothetical protein